MGGSAKPARMVAARRIGLPAPRAGKIQRATRPLSVTSQNSTHTAADSARVGPPGSAYPPNRTKVRRPRVTTQWSRTHPAPGSATGRTKEST